MFDHVVIGVSNYAASKAFFEQAQRMAQEHPALFAQLRQYYCVDPLSW